MHTYQVTNSTKSPPPGKTPGPSHQEKQAMANPAPVIVQRHGFFSTLAMSVATVVSVTLLCGSAVTIYGIKVVNDRAEDIISLSPDAIAAATQWQDALPLAIKDAINDARAPEYRAQITAQVELIDDWKHDRRYGVVEITNRGDKLVSLMCLRIQFEDSQGLPVYETTTYAATPLAIEDEWRGPLMPGDTRRFRLKHSYLLSDYTDLRITHEISDLRVWTPTNATAESVEDLADKVESPSPTQFTSQPQ